MANYTTYINLELPVSPERYNIDVFNKNNMVIDSELHKLDLKNESQDNLLDGITIDKVNISDIIDNLTSIDIDKPLSANRRI